MADQPARGYGMETSLVVENKVEDRNVEGREERCDRQRTGRRIEAEERLDWLLAGAVPDRAGSAVSPRAFPNP